MLSTKQVAALSTTQVNQGLSTDQVVALTTAQAQQGLTTAQVQSLTTAQVAALETRDLAVLGTAQVRALTTAQVNQGLSTGQVVAALTTTQVRQGLTTSQVLEGLSTAQVVALTTAQVAALTTSQVDALSTTQVEALTTTQRGALTTSQIPALDTSGTPLVLDLNGNGISTQSINKGVKFDIYGVGQDVRTGWVADGDGLLVMDRNRDGQINGGVELFGEGTVLDSGQKALNGYQALAELDSSGDGSISASDQSFVDLMVWVDGNSDGVSDASELHSLNSLGITSLDLSAQASTETDNGNLIGLVSGYTTSDGNTHQMADVWFATKDVSGETAETIPDNLVAPPINLIIPESVSAPSVTVEASRAPVPATDLRTQVVGMVDAMHAFNSAGSPQTAGVSASLSLKTESPDVQASAGVLGMVDALKQFDANGQPVLAGVGKSVASAPITLNTTQLRKPDIDLLASSK